ncbi:MAG: recombinase family protein [Planctomycetes bacterium]|nr:recombinase family protein [Planctomycetota bacterium]
MPTAYSYIRFSSPEQAEGDSVRRQTENKNREAWLAAHPDVILDTALEMTDAGRSGFTRDDWDTYALAGFLQKVETGYVPRGSFLLVENLDRLSREVVGTGLELFLSIIRKGIVIVQLSPTIMEFRHLVNVQDLMFTIFELSRGHSESKMKSERVGAAWANKRKAARSLEATPMQVPHWLVRGEKKGDRPTVNEEKANVVRRLFKLALEGKGCCAIAKIMNTEKVPVLGKKQMPVPGQLGVKKAEKKYRPVAWSESGVRFILRSAATIGYFQPHTGRLKTRKTDGDPIKGYYPSIISEQDYYAVQSGLTTRAGKGAGRHGRHVNLFAGLLTDARNGGTFTYKHLKNRTSIIVPVNAKGGRGGHWSSFPAAPFETAVISALTEVTVADIQGENDAAKNVAAIAGRIEKQKSLKAAWEKKMDDEDIVDTVAAKLAGINLTLRGLHEELAAAQRDAANPVAEAWGEARTLMGLMMKDPSDEMRTKVKAALRRSISGIRCVFMGLDKQRMAYVVVGFKSGATQTYFAEYLHAYKGTNGTLNCVSIRDSGFEWMPLRLDEPNAVAMLEEGVMGVRHEAGEEGKTVIECLFSGTPLVKGKLGVSTVTLLPTPNK